MKLGKNRSFYMLEESPPDGPVILYDEIGEAAREIADRVRREKPTGRMALSMVTVEEGQITVSEIAFERNGETGDMEIG